MSYCRWSSDDWRCDLYCYEDCNGGWTTHVAGSRIVPPPPRVKARCADVEEWCEQHDTQVEYVKSAEREYIGLAHDGETFSDPTLDAFKARLLMLRAAGYNFPDHVLEHVAEEIAAQ